MKSGNAESGVNIKARILGAEKRDHGLSTRKEGRFKKNIPLPYTVFSYSPKVLLFVSDPSLRSQPLPAAMCQIYIPGQCGGLSSGWGESSPGRIRSELGQDGKPEKQQQKRYPHRPLLYNSITFIFVLYFILRRMNYA